MRSAVQKKTRSKIDPCGGLSNILGWQAFNLVTDLGSRPTNPQLVEPTTESLAKLGLNDVEASASEHEPDCCCECGPLLWGKVVGPAPAGLTAVLVGVELDVPLTGCDHGRSTYTGPPRRVRRCVGEQRR